LMTFHSERGCLNFVFRQPHPQTTFLWECTSKNRAYAIALLVALMVSMLIVK
jgi:hypothetical protein